MKIKLAENSGFCFGVKRAIKIALDESTNGGKIVTLGPIIHNPQMVKKLEDKGIKTINTPDEGINKSVIIRSHGVEKEVLAKLISNNCTVIDATCPFVAKAQRYASELSSLGYPLIILGDKNHPEVIALKSYVNGEVYIANSPADIPNKHFDKVAMISQTTQSLTKLQKLADYLLAISNELVIRNTICNATEVRQASTVQLAQLSQLMIVIGGKNSANTKMLYKISKQVVPTHHIETADEFKSEWFSNIEKIGITAGASTPDWIIIDVYNKIQNFHGDMNQQVQNVEDIPVLRRNNVK